MEVNARWFRKYYNIFLTSVKRLYLEDYSYQASALSFITLLSMVPVLSVVLFILSYFDIYNEFINFSEDYIFANFLPDSAQVIKTHLHQFASQADHLPFISIIFCFITATLMLITMEKAFNSIYEEKNTPKKLFWKLLSWTLALLIILLVALLSFISGSLFSYFIYNHVPVIPLQVVNFIINSILLAILYVYIPNHNINWRSGLFGGCSSALLFEFGRHIFSYYIYYLTYYNDIYGSLAVIPIFLLWIYISWIFILLGAILIYEKEKLKQKLKKP